MGRGQGDFALVSPVDRCPGNRVQLRLAGADTEPVERLPQTAQHALHMQG
jgi:hypothetical protein